ncbi:MAG: ABC transporter permease, partial [Chloroflexi bacterium]|nr:ABC transporter permease [Chloroflexota bacterium]
MITNEKTFEQSGEINNIIRPPETMMSLAWKRFRRHPGAMVGAIVMIFMILTAVFAPLSPYDPVKSDIKNRFQAPSWEHPFGTDGLGRDLMTRTFYGGRVSMTVGIMVVAITLGIGIPVG